MPSPRNCEVFRRNPGPRPYCGSTSGFEHFGTWFGDTCRTTSPFPGPGGPAHDGGRHLRHDRAWAARACAPLLRRHGHPLPGTAWARSSPPPSAGPCATRQGGLHGRATAAAAVDAFLDELADPASPVAPHRQQLPPGPGQAPGPGRRTAGQPGPRANCRSHHIRRFVGLPPRPAAWQAAPSARSAVGLARSSTDWLGRHGHAVRANPCEGVRPPKSPQGACPAFPVGRTRAARLLETSIDPDDPLQERTGCRPCSSCSIPPACAWRNWPSWIVDALDSATSHGGEDPGPRQAGQGAGCARRQPRRGEALAAWDGAAGRAWPEAGGEAALFVGASGAGASAHGIIQQSASRRKGSCWLGLPTPRASRTCCATPLPAHVLQSSGDLRAVQEMLGHASIASTQVYTHLDFQHLAKVYDAAHPRSRRDGAVAVDRQSGPESY